MTQNPAPTGPLTPCDPGQVSSPPSASVSSSGPCAVGRTAGGENAPPARASRVAEGGREGRGPRAALTRLAGRRHLQTLLVCPDATLGAQVALVEGAPAVGAAEVRRTLPWPRTPEAVRRAQDRRGRLAVCLSHAAPPLPAGSDADGDGDGASPGQGGGCSAGLGPHLRNILQALQLVALSNVYIWKLWWLAVALSGLMFDLTAGKGAPDSLSPEPGSARRPARARASGGVRGCGADDSPPRRRRQPGPDEGLARAGAAGEAPRSARGGGVS